MTTEFEDGFGVADDIFRFRLRVEIGGCTGVETVRISGGDVVFVKDATIVAILKCMPSVA